MKPVGSMFTGLTDPTRTQGSLPEGGSNAGRDGSVASPEDTAAVLAWLSRHSPAEVDAAVVLRASQLGVALKANSDIRGRYDEHGAFLGYVTTRRWYEAVGTDDDKARVADALRKMEARAPQDAIEGWLAELSVITAKRADDEFTETLRLAAYASRLSAYPADVARAACLGREWRWWPTWAELKDECDRLAAPRREMASALRIAAQPRQEAPADDRKRVTPERAAEIMREIWGERA